MVKLSVKDNENKEEIIEVDEWSPQKFGEEMQNNDSPGIFIGTTYYWKIDVRRVKVLEG